MGSSSQSFNKGRTNAPTPAASHILYKMAYAEPHENYDRHMENIEVAVEGERDAMEVAEAETRRATKKWRQFSVWLAHDSNARKLPAGNFGRRLGKAKLVWWASKKADRSRDIDFVIADAGHNWLSVADQSSVALRSQTEGRGRTP